MFKKIIKTVYHYTSDDEFVAEITDQRGAEDHDDEGNARIKPFGNRRNNVIDTRDDIPDNPDGYGKRTDDEQTLKKRLCKGVKKLFGAFAVHVEGII